MKQGMMEAVVTTGAISCANSNHDTPTNQHLVFLQAGCPSCHPTNSVKALKVKITFHGLTYPKLTWGLPTLSLTTNSSWLSWGGLPCHQPSDATQLTT